MNRGGLLWALSLLFLCDLSMPLLPGVFQFEPGQSLEMARSISVHTASAGQLPALQHRYPARAHPAPRPALGQGAVLRREATSARAFVPFRSPQDESEALTSEDPPLLV
jgi:hypothetical protein